MATYEITSIGTIYTPFEQKVGVPVQAKMGGSIEGYIEMKDPFVEGLKDLEGFSHAHLIYVFNRHNDYKMIVRPYMDETLRGVYATRCPKRPNQIGLSLVELVEIKGSRVSFKGVDMLNGTPLMDIKPYYHDFDHRENSSAGWLDKVKKRRVVADDRF
ncbi:MAG: tRNA (N6-threonylcarbamoyladenosine(37)-N6)-methyltransferase TrmO [Acidobacteria bacterium]|nr:MAG: tRNA (N6-threonylcarbamoyladenosine(37)-N6)-methyltransferase TrmO [Acidobacteriota bacterium]